MSFTTYWLTVLVINVLIVLVINMPRVTLVSIVEIQEACGADAFHKVARLKRLQEVAAPPNTLNRTP